MKLDVNIIALKALCKINCINEYDDEDKEDSFTNESSTGFSYCSSIYPFTNEGIIDYYKEFDFDGKRILTVCASGDHVLNAILLGAKEIDCFDISMFSFPYFDLKRAAVKALTYDEYLQFFVDLDTRFSLKLYSKIYNYLMPESKLFWDNLYLECAPRNIKSQNFFSYLGISRCDVIGLNNYLNSEKEYYELKKKIDNCKVDFFNIDIKYLASKATGFYDFIGLSNIYGRANDNEGSIDCEILKLSELLNVDGVMVINYDWGFDCEISDELKKQLGKEHKIKTLTFTDFTKDNNSIVYCQRL